MANNKDSGEKSTCEVSAKSEHPSTEVDSSSDSSDSSGSGSSTSSPEPDSVNWRKKWATVADVWLAALEDSRFTDVSFLVGKGDLAKKFSAHTCVLAFCSPVFEEKFIGPHADKSDIEVPDVEPEIFQKLLQYAYGKPMNITSFPEAGRIYFAADKYSIFQLKTLAERYILNTPMMMKDFWEIAQSEDLFNIRIIEIKCVAFLKGNPREIFESVEFGSVSISSLSSILALTNMNCPEFEVMRAVIKWAKKNSDDGDQFKALVKSFISMRFNHISAVDFCKLHELCGDVLGDQESLMIMKHKLDKTCELPDWCPKEVEESDSDSSSGLEESVALNVLQVIAGIQERATNSSQ